MLLLFSNAWRLHWNPAESQGELACAPEHKNLCRFQMIKSHMFMVQCRPHSLGFLAHKTWWIEDWVNICSSCCGSVVMVTRPNVTNAHSLHEVFSPGFCHDKCVHAIILSVKATSELLFTLTKLMFFQLKMWLLHPPCLFLASSHLIWCCKCSWLGSSSSKRYFCSLIVWKRPLFQELLLFCGFIFQMSNLFIFAQFIFPVDLVTRLIY